MASQGTQIGNKYYTTAQINDPNMQDEITQAVVGGGAIRNNMGNGNWEQQANGMNQVSQSQSYGQSQQPSVYDPTADIKAMNEYRKQQAIAGLGKARDNSLSNLSADRAKIQPTYYNNRAETSTASQLGAKNLAEYMASRGQSSSGASIQGEINRTNQLTGDINNWKTQEQGAFNDNTRSVTNTNNAYESDVQSTNAGIEADGMQQLITAQQNMQAQKLAQANADRGFNYQVGRDTIGDNRYNTETSYNQGQDLINQTGQFANGQYTQQGQANQMNMQIQQAQLKEMQDPNSTTNQMAKLGLDTARLNFAQLPQQLQAQAQQVVQQLRQGAIDMKTAQIKLDYLPRQMQADLNQSQAQTSAANRSNQGGGGSSGGLTPTQQRAASAKETKNAAYAQFNKAMSAGNGSQWLISNAENIFSTLGEDVYYDMEKRVTTDKNFTMEVMKDKANRINSSPQ